MPYKWPTDPPGKKASHSISWQKHQQNSRTPGGGMPGSSITGWGGWTSAGGLPGHAGVPPNSQGFPSTFAAPPFDAELEARKIAANKRRTDLLSDQQVDLKQTAQEYGFKYNPANGAFGGFDPTNPFSQAALLMKARKERDQGENTGFASSGQLYSGAYGDKRFTGLSEDVGAKKETGVQYNKGYDTLRRGFDNYVKNYLRRRRDIQTVGIDELANL